MCHCGNILDLLASGLSGVKVEILHGGAERVLSAVSADLVLDVLGYFV